VEDPRALLATAVEHHGRGELQQADALYTRILRVDPRHWEALYLHGTALLQLGRFDESIEVLERVAAQRPDVPDAANNLAIAYQAIGRLDDAARCFEAAVRARPEFAQGVFNLAALCERRGDLPGAEKHFRRLAALQPDDSAPHDRLGNVLKGQGRFADAEKCYRASISRAPENVDALVNLGYVLVQQERLEEAAASYRRVLELRPDSAEACANLSYVHERAGQIDEAVAAAERAVEIAPASAEAYNNLGVALRSAHRLDDACRAFARAVEISPEFALARFNWGTTLLLGQHYHEGWPLYLRHAESLAAAEPPTAAPRWNGAPIPGKTLLVHADQGFGDTIQFARFLPAVRHRAQAKLIFQHPPALTGLMDNISGADVSLPGERPLPDCDFQLPLSDVPALLDVGLDSLVSAMPYLTAPTSLRQELESLLPSAEPAAWNIGLVWQGNPRQARDVVRSCPLRELRPLFEVPRATFFSLQIGDAGRRQWAALFPSGPPRNVRDAGPLLRSFSDTAAFMSRLDLLIVVDTAAAHLAGALGRPTWTLLCHTPDWRWHLARGDCPWYPTLRLFRQPRWGDWRAVVTEVAAELRRLTASAPERFTANLPRAEEAP